jgi:hypothetical protein
VAAHQPGDRLRSSQCVRALTALERAHGVTEAHRYPTAKIKAYGALLRHADTHRAEVLTHALSPCGRYLAPGSAVGEKFDDGGVLQTWEVAGGRCVNVIDGIPGGVGWESDRYMIQWSADASRVAVVHEKSMVGVWESFGGRETHDLGGPPPAWSLDERHLAHQRDGWRSWCSRTTTSA